MEGSEIVGWAACISTLLAAVISGLLARQARNGEVNRIAKSKAIYISIIVTALTSVVLGFLIKKIVFKEKADLILFGSGSVYAYLSKNYKKIFINKDFQIVRLDAPTLSAKRIIVYSFTRIEAQQVKLPSLIGMASYELRDSSFTIPDQKIGGDDIKFYAINIKEDTLIASFGATTDAVRSKLGYLGKLGKSQVISAEKLKNVIQEVSTVFIPTAESGTYKRWQELFEMNGITWPKNKIRIADVSPGSQSDIYNTRGSWVALSSKDFNLAKKVKSFEVEAIFNNNGHTAVRPLYLYGFVAGKMQNISDRDMFIIDDEVVYKFWTELLFEMSKNKQYSQRAEAIKKNFLIDIGSNKLGVVFQQEHDKVMVFDGSNSD